MAFTDNGFSTEQKMRITLSPKAFITVREDMEKYGIANASSFINTLFTNFRDDAKSSISYYLDEKKMELQNTLKKSTLPDSAISETIEKLLNKEKKAVTAIIKGYKNRKGSATTSKIYHINKENTDYLLEECPESENGIYSRPGLYLKCLVEEYCDLPFIERERIYKKNIYKLVEDACLTRSQLKIRTNNKKGSVFLVQPYKIVSDPMGTQSYLVCKSRPMDNPDAPMEIVSFNMCRMSEPRVLKAKGFFFSEKAKEEIEKKLTHTSPAYLTDDSQEIHVRLTDEGKHIFHTKLNSRPVKDTEKSTDNEYVFYCSKRQAYNYFFSFGQNAEILNPPEIREMFKAEYQKALNNYINTKDSLE